MCDATNERLPFVANLALADEDAFECLPELEIKNGVNDGIDERIDVTQPGGELEHGHARLTRQIKLGANGVHNVAREKWHPTDKKNAFEKIKFIIN